MKWYEEELIRKRIVKSYLCIVRPDVHQRLCSRDSLKDLEPSKAQFNKLAATG